MTHGAPRTTVVLRALVLSFSSFNGLTSAKEINGGKGTATAVPPTEYSVARIIDNSSRWNGKSGFGTRQHNVTNCSVCKHHRAGKHQQVSLLQPFHRSPVGSKQIYLRLLGATRVRDACKECAEGKANSWCYTITRSNKAIRCST